MCYVKVDWTLNRVDVLVVRTAATDHFVPMLPPYICRTFHVALSKLQCMVWIILSYGDSLVSQFAVVNLVHLCVSKVNPHGITRSMHE